MSVVVFVGAFLCCESRGGETEELHPQPVPRQKRLNAQQKLRSRLGVHVVIWEVTTDMKGKVETARVVKVIPPDDERIPLTPADIPIAYQENARKKIAQRKYRVMTEVVEVPTPPQKKGRRKRSRLKGGTTVTRVIPMKVFTSSYYDPRRPEEVIVRLPRR